jgi:Fuc2NAc and GlcNAc transferase
MQFVLCLLVFVLSIILTGQVCQWAWSLGVVDEPGGRRSHLLPTPRGGGLAIVLSFWTWVICSIYLFQLPSFFWLTLSPSILVAMVGFWDDVSSVSAKKRLFFQFFCAILSLKLMGGIQVVLTIKGILVPATLVNLMALFFLVWSINLYNFMDGINGLAGFEAVSVAIFMALITFQDHAQTWSLMWFVLASAAGGFLLWNFPKAKIFMGDGGSYFLGFMFGLLLILSANVTPRWFWCGLILLGYFVVDATLTLCVRAWYRQPLMNPHQSHAFQIMLKNFRKSHVAVTSVILLINCVWLFPLALLVSKGYTEGFMTMLIAYFPLVIIVCKMKAGRPMN